MTDQPFNPSDDNPVPPGYELTASFEDPRACQASLDAIKGDPDNPADGICKYNTATGEYDLYVYAPGDSDWLQAR